MQTIRQLAGALILTTSLMTLTATAEQAPKAPRPQAPAPVRSDYQARDTSEQLNELFNQYPSTLREVLRLDPTLLSDRDYLALYPALDSFLVQHPEIAHNPGYFVGDSRMSGNDPQLETARMRQNMMSDLAGFTVLVTVIGIFAWIVRSIIEYRRWNRTSKVQAEVHTRLLDRFTTNEDLLAYIQTSAGKQFLKSGPLATEPGFQSLGAPVSRIMWSVQAGLVLLFAGAGLYFAAPASVANSGGEPLTVISILAMALGLGFMISGAASYVISHRLGLFENRQEPSQP